MGIPIFRRPGTGLGEDIEADYAAEQAYQAQKSTQVQGSNIAGQVIGGIKDIFTAWTSTQQNQQTGTVTPKPPKVPTAPATKDNTGLYVGLGIAAVAVIGLGFAASRK